jgi:hypothetical protein
MSLSLAFYRAAVVDEAVAVVVDRISARRLWRSDGSASVVRKAVDIVVPTVLLGRALSADGLAQMVRLIAAA